MLLDSLVFPKSLDEVLYHEFCQKFNKQVPTDWGSAVLMIYHDDRLLFIKRSDNVTIHKGEIAFLGGHREARETPIETCLREFEEESSLNSSNLCFKGVFPPIQTLKQKNILPLLFSYKNSFNDFKQALSNGEWSVLFSFPLQLLTSKKLWRWGRFSNQAGSRDVMLMPLNRDRIEIYAMHGEQVLIRKNFCSSDPILWGATAAMIVQFTKVTEMLSGPTHKSLF